MKARISPLVRKILNSDNKKAVNALLKTRLTREEFEFEDETYVVIKTSSCYRLKPQGYPNPLLT